MALKFSDNSTCAGRDNQEEVSDAVVYPSIGEFYRGAIIFITGGSGFVGKVLIEKLLRSCDLIDTVYVLLRSKRGKTIDKRHAELFAGPVFGKIRDKNPDLFDKVHIMEGDISQPGIGLNDSDRAKLVAQVTIVFHSAATVRFNETLKVAVTLNTIGTQRVVELCLQMPNLKSFVYVSTAYTNADKKDVNEIVYQPPIEPMAVINCVENLPDEVLGAITGTLLGRHPNTYTFSKSLAEHIVLANSDRLPAAIVRPSVVTGAWREPYAGFVDNVSGATGLIMEISRGAVKSVLSDDSLSTDLIPVDIVINALVGAAWHTVACPSNDMRVYNCTSGQINGLTNGRHRRLIIATALEYPTQHLSWYPGFRYCTSRPLHWLYCTFVHKPIACLSDVLLYCTGRKPMMYRVYKKFARLAKDMEFFSLTEWHFHVDTMRALSRAVRGAPDGDDYSVDMGASSGFSWESYTRTYMLGIRQYVLKEEPSSLPAARAKLKRFYWLNRSLQFLILYILIRIVIAGNRTKLFLEENFLNILDIY